MAQEFFKKYGAYIELGLHLLAFISVFLPFIKNLSATKFRSGTGILVLNIFAAFFVAVDAFYGSMVKNLKKVNEKQGKYVEYALDLIPFVIDIISLVLTITLASSDYFKGVSFGVGFYFLLFSLIIIIIVRILHFILVKQYINVTKPVEREINDEV